MKKNVNPKDFDVDIKQVLRGKTYPKVAGRQDNDTKVYPKVAGRQGNDVKGKRFRGINL